MAVFNYEKKFRKKGYKKIVGLDEAGRGPLSGPVVVSGVMVSPEFFYHEKKMVGIKDSKKLSFKQRERFYDILTSHPRIKWAVSRVSPGVIDRINILEATKLAMKRVSEKLEADFLIIDGNFKLNVDDIPQQSVVRGDQKVFSCMASGIIAKVTRDRMMIRYHKKYPRYSFCDHKGYPTKKHKKLIKKYGPCKLHRKSFNWG